MTLQLFEHERRAVEIDLEDRRRRCLRGGDTGSMDQPSDLSKPAGRFDERLHSLTRGHVDCRDTHIVTGVAEDLGSRAGIVRAHIGQQDMLPDADPRAMACPI